jgi:hypothetical protein
LHRGERCFSRDFAPRQVDGDAAGKAGGPGARFGCSLRCSDRDLGIRAG